jgi:CRP/FNR family cyclic AMP-dependent transcriptional regulator
MLQELAGQLAAGWAKRFQAPNPLIVQPFEELRHTCAGPRSDVRHLAAIVRAVAGNDAPALEACALQWGSELARSGATPEEAARVIWLAVGSLWDDVPAGLLSDAFSRLRRHILFSAAQVARERPALTLVDLLLSPPSRSPGVAFDALLHEVLARARTFRLVTYRRRQVIFSPTTAARHCYVVMDGHVRLFELLRDGRAVTLALLGPGAIFSAPSHGPAMLHATHAESFRVSRHIVLSEMECLRLLPLVPILAVRMVQSFQEQITDLRQLVAILLGRDVTVRLAHVLLCLADHFGHPAGEGLVYLGLHFTHQELADMVGSNRVTITNELHDLERRGLIRREPRHHLAIHRPSLEGLLS